MIWNVCEALVDMDFSMDSLQANTKEPGILKHLRIQNIWSSFIKTNNSNTKTWEFQMSPSSEP